MKRPKQPKAGLDTQCLSYLLDAIAGIAEPTDALADERKALIRSWFYNRDVFYLSETVVAECNGIKDAGRRAFHQSFIRTLFLNVPPRDRAGIDRRVAELKVKHPKEKDCRVLAEAEDLELQVLLSYDHRFRRRFEGFPTDVRLLAPTVYWGSLQIPKGVRPKLQPHATNPLSQQQWWRW